MLVTSEIPRLHPLKETVETVIMDELARTGGWAAELLVRDSLWCVRLVRALDGYSKVLVLRPGQDAAEVIRTGMRQVIEAANVSFSTEVEAGPGTGTAG